VGGDGVWGGTGGGSDGGGGCAVELRVGV
jgi:hypothetical protein